MAQIRLQKYMADCGVASRRQSETMIAQGRVTVNGDVVRELGVKVLPGVDKVAVDGKEIAVQAADFVKSLYDEGYVAEGITDHQQFFQGGKAAFYFGGTWGYGALSQTDGLNFSGMAWPNLFGQDASWADSHTLILPVNPDRTEEETLAAVEFLVGASNEGGMIWAESGQIPAAC